MDVIKDGFKKYVKYKKGMSLNDYVDKIIKYIDEIDETG